MEKERPRALPLQAHILRCGLKVYLLSTNHRRIKPGDFEKFWILENFKSILPDVFLTTKEFLNIGNSISYYIYIYIYILIPDVPFFPMF